MVGVALLSSPSTSPWGEPWGPKNVNPVGPGSPPAIPRAPNSGQLLSGSEVWVGEAGGLLLSGWLLSNGGKGDYRARRRIKGSEGGNWA